MKRLEAAPRRDSVSQVCQRPPCPVPMARPRCGTYDHQSVAAHRPPSRRRRGASGVDRWAGASIVAPARPRGDPGPEVIGPGQPRPPEPLAGRGAPGCRGSRSRSRSIRSRVAASPSGSAPSQANRSPNAHGSSREATKPGRGRSRTARWNASLASLTTGSSRSRSRSRPTRNTCAPQPSYAQTPRPVSGRCRCAGRASAAAPRAPARPGRTSARRRPSARPGTRWSAASRAAPGASRCGCSGSARC